MAGIHGDIGFPSASLPVNTDFGSLAKSLKIGFMGAAEVRYKRLMVIADGNFMTLKGEKPLSTLLGSSAAVESTFAFGTAKVAYLFEPSPGLALKPYAGARWWSVSADLQVNGGALDGAQASFDRAWADPVFGLSVRYDITDKWFVRGVGDVGGGVSDLTWQIYGATGYQFTDWFGLTLGYRYLGVDYDRDGFKLDIVTSGLLVGVEFRL